MKFSSISKVAAATILGGVFFVGCGVDQNTSSVSGQGLAEYIQGGEAFIDCNKNTVKDPGEVSAKTDANGNFTVSSICTDYNLVILGGINSNTKQDITVPTIAKKGITKVSPLTSMFVDLDETATTALLTAMGISKSDLSLDYNKFGGNAAKIKGIKNIIETTIASTKATDIKGLQLIAKSFVAAAKDGIDLSSEIAAKQFTAKLSTEIINNAEADKTLNLSTDKLSTALVTSAKNSSVIANATSQDELTDKSKIAEDANANIIADNAGITRLTLGSSLQIGDINTTLTNGTFSAVVDTNSSTKIADFYNIAIAQPTLNQDINGTEKVSLTLSIAAKTTNVGDKIVLKINTVDLTSSSKTLTSTIPSGTTVTLSSTGLTGISNVTKDTNASVSNSDLSVNVNNLLKVLDGDMSTQITALNTYLTTPNSYDVNLTIDGLSSKLTTSYKSITGTVEVK